MKKNALSSSILAATIVLSLFVSCKKDKDLSRKDMLTTGKWKTIAQTVSPAVDWDLDGDIDTDLYIIMDACLKDNYGVFRPDGTGEENEGSLKCDVADPQIEPFNWSIKNNDSILLVDGDEFIIEQLTETTMKLIVSDNGLTITSTLQKF